MADYKLTEQGCRRLRDGANIPAHQANADWQLFLDWKKLGGVPEPIDPPPPPSQDEVDAQSALADAEVALLTSMTPQQAAEYIDAQVTSVASARATLRMMARILCVLARRL
jgi:hypothetical protein